MELDDLYFMNQALLEAEKSLEKSEVPVGAVIVVNKKIIGRGHNLIEKLEDVTAHAEMQAITAASNFLNGKFLDQCSLYVTLEGRHCSCHCLADAVLVIQKYFS